MRPLLSLLPMLLFTINSFAQFGYRFSVKQETYQPLTTGVSINNNKLWDEDVFKIPVGFSFLMDDRTIDSCYLTGPTALANDTIGSTISMFWTILADMYDRGTNNGGTSQSPLSYQLTGNLGSRICKIEIANAAFWDEYDLYATSDDFINLQIWLYEGSNALELRYGPSKVTHPTDYFLLNSNPLAGLFRISPEGDSVYALYYLHGNPAGPELGSISAPEDLNVLLLPHALNVMPAQGTVYRFERLPTAITTPATLLSDVLLYPMPCHDQLVLQCNSGQLRYQICNIAGVSTGIEGKAEQGVHAIDVSRLAAGQYIMQLEGGLRKLKFVKQ